MSIMNTCTGRKFDPMHIKPENICLEDIAHALLSLPGRRTDSDLLLCSPALPQLRKRSPGQRMV